LKHIVDYKRQKNSKQILKYKSKDVTTVEALSDLIDNTTQYF